LWTIPTVCHLLINGLLAHPKRIEFRDLSRDRTRDGSDDLLLIWSRETRSPDGLARAPCFSGSRAGLITGFTYGTFDLELVILDVVDCVRDIRCLTPCPCVNTWTPLFILIDAYNASFWPHVASCPVRLPHHQLSHSALLSTPEVFADQLKSVCYPS
jgi:hypothetical protein